MQPPPSSFRSSFPVHPRRPRTSSRASKSKPASLTRLLAGAAAIAASKAWVVDDPSGSSGGAGWLVLSYWAGRVVGEMQDARRDRKGKRKEESTGPAWSLQHAGAATVLGTQSIAFFTTLQAFGPLGSGVIAVTGGLLGSSRLRDKQTVVAVIPALLGCAACVLAHGIPPRTGAVFSALILLLSTAVIGGPLAGVLDNRSRKVRSGSAGPPRKHLIALSGGVALALSFALWLMPHFLGPFFAAALARYVPLPFTAGSSSRPAARLGTSRDVILLLCMIAALQVFAFPPFPSSLDLLLVLPLVMASVLLHPSLAVASISGEESLSRTISQTLITTTASPRWSIIPLLPAHWRPHLQTILNTPASRQIFYFLLLNLAYMGVQMGYGVLTNSLGLISDAIHMLFDCLGIGVGLWASVAATWKPDGQYTFGYSRVETLSGFANGCFLILISIFIMFEAIQRVMDPPEMDTHQLLTVSVVGLLINLFGIIPVHEKKEDHRHTNGVRHNRADSEGHTSAMTARPDLDAGRRRVSAGVPEPSTIRPITTIIRTPMTIMRVLDTRMGMPTTITIMVIMDMRKIMLGHTRMATHTFTRKHPRMTTRTSTITITITITVSSTAMIIVIIMTTLMTTCMNMSLTTTTDTLGSVGVIISTILIKWTGWTGFDPIASLFIAVMIAASVIPLVIDSGRVLVLDVGAETESDIRRALAALATVEGLSHYGAPRFWPRCEGELVGSIHIQLAPSRSNHDPTRFSTPAPYKGQAIYTNSDKVVARVDKLLKSRIRGLTELVIQIEGSEEKAFCSCMTGGG
ncbi:putative zinc transporter msc2 [Saitozyma podzolica]|uniref:Putative zinc transporter msc2 n=1 Tax=Saitozyma podzolica TaxID=1890683 RepID=A0A427YUR4_9TREE|nr:putative zinc transporter msc2 [Saitozyma podzolica]